MIDGVTHQLDNGAELELAEEMGPMGFDRLAAHSQLAGYLFGRMPFGDQAQGFGFAAGEGLVRARNTVGAGAWSDPATIMVT